MMEARVRILVVRLSSLGDIARLLPSLGAARAAHPGHGFDLTVEDRFLPLLSSFLPPTGCWLTRGARPVTP